MVWIHENLNSSLWLSVYSAWISWIWPKNSLGNCLKTSFLCWPFCWYFEKFLFYIVKILTFHHKNALYSKKQSDAVNFSLPINSWLVLEYFWTIFRSNFAGLNFSQWKNFRTKFLFCRSSPPCKIGPKIDPSGISWLEENES